MIVVVYIRLMITFMNAIRYFSLCCVSIFQAEVLQLVCCVCAAVAVVCQNWSIVRSVLCFVILAPSWCFLWISCSCSVVFVKKFIVWPIHGCCIMFTADNATELTC